MTENKQTKHTLKSPLRLDVNGSYATVCEADGNVVPELTDVELGWTDTSTGVYQDPADSLDRLYRIVACVNALAGIEHPEGVGELVETAQDIVDLAEASDMDETAYKIQEGRLNALRNALAALGVKHE